MLSPNLSRSEYAVFDEEGWKETHPFIEEAGVRVVRIGQETCGRNGARAVCGVAAPLSAAD